MDDIDTIISKYSLSVLKNINLDNVIKIIRFLEDMGCSYINDLLEDYLDLFNIDYDRFVDKFNLLNEKYNNKYLDCVYEDMNLLEGFFED